jgi:hypothetical protein
MTMVTELFGNVDEHIIGGSAVTNETKHPHQVWILMDSSYFCGGIKIFRKEPIITLHVGLYIYIYIYPN